MPAAWEESIPVSAHAPGSPHEDRVERVTRRQLLRVLRLPGQEPRVLHATDGVSEDRAAAHLPRREIPPWALALVLQLGLAGQLALAHARDFIREGR
jgi:hypothetical protein